MLLTKNEERKFEEMCAQLTMYGRNLKVRYQALVVRSYASKKQIDHSSTKSNVTKDDTCKYRGRKGHCIHNYKKWIGHDNLKLVSNREVG